MINQGFVTDSDTEKELKKWQQARTTAVDEDKLKQQYKNRLNNAQGQHFEREILAGCRMYESHGIATIDKTPEPFRVTSKNHRTGEFTGRFSTHAQPDFQGTLYGGRSIMFEAKRTSKDRITRNVLTDTQMDVLENGILDIPSRRNIRRGRSGMHDIRRGRKRLYTRTGKQTCYRGIFIF